MAARSGVLQGIDQALRHDLAHAVDRGEFGPVRRAGRRFGDRRLKRLPRGVVAGKETGGDLADMADAQGKDQPVERDGPPRLDRSEKLGGGDFPKAVAILQLLQGVVRRLLQRA